MTTIRNAALLVACSFASGLLWPVAVHAQRVLECSLVSIDPPSSTMEAWHYAAEISNGSLVMLLTRPDGADPYITNFKPLRGGRSSDGEIENSSSGDAATADFYLATLGAGGTVTIDHWQFGGTEAYRQITLKCPLHA